MAKKSFLFLLLLNACSYGSGYQGQYDDIQDGSVESPFLDNPDRQYIDDDFDFESVDPEIDREANCSIVTYQSEYQEKTIYRSKTNKKYVVLMDYQSIKDVADNKVSTREIVEIADTAVQTLEEEGYLSHERVYEKELSYFHVILTSTRKEFALLFSALRKGDTFRSLVEETNNYSGYISTNKFCWDDTDVNFTTVIMNKEISIYLIVHELMHVISYYETGDGDSDHLNAELWHEAGGEDSLMWRIIQNYLTRKFLENN